MGLVVGLCGFGLVVLGGVWLGVFGVGGSVGGMGCSRRCCIVCI